MFLSAALGAISQHSGSGTQSTGDVGSHTFVTGALTAASVRSSIDSESPAATGDISAASVSPDLSIFNYYDQVGYNGNSTIYPTDDQTPYYLPPLSSVAYQTPSNATWSVENIATIETCSCGAYTPRYWNLGSAGNDQFNVWVWVTGQDASIQTTEDTEGCNDPLTSYWTNAQEVSATPAGLPSSNTNEVILVNDTGTNVTLAGSPPNQGVQADQLALISLQGVELLADVASSLDPISVSTSATYLHQVIGPAGPYSGSVPEATGDNSAIQWGGVDNGTWTNFCQNLQGGQDVFGQSDLIEEAVPGTGLASVDSGQLTFSAYNQLEELDGINNQPYTTAGSTASLSYPIAPAVSIGGVAYLYNNTACYPNCPTVPGASVDVTQFTGSGPSYESHYWETTSSGGYWHLFAMPKGDYSTTEWGASWSNALGQMTNTTAKIANPSMDQGKNSALDVNFDGGRVEGWVTNASDAGAPVSSIPVEFCNSNGCVSGSTSSSGFYSFDIPVAGTSTDPYSLTLTDPGMNGTEYTGLLFPVGQTSFSNASVSIPTYAVKFAETGLPASENWSVTLGTSESYSTLTSIFFSEPDATYTYSVETIPVPNKECPGDYVPSPSSGQFSLDGSSYVVSVTYTFEDKSGLCPALPIAPGNLAGAVLITAPPAIAVPRPLATRISRLVRGRQGGR